MQTTSQILTIGGFYINLPIDGVTLITMLLLLDIQTPKTPIIEGLIAIDWLGSLLVVGGTLLFLFGLSYGGQSFPWSSATVICLIVFGILTLMLFILVDWKAAKYPVMPMRIFQGRGSAACLGVCFLHSMVFIVGSYYMPLYFQVVRGATLLLSGVYILPQLASLGFANMSDGILIRKTGQYLSPILISLALMTLGYGLYVDLDPNSSLAKIILFQILGGLGIGPNFQTLLVALQTIARPRDIATATAAFQFVRYLATSTSIVVGQVIIQNRMSEQLSILAHNMSDPQLVAELTDANAAANTRRIQSLPAAQQQLAISAFANSLRTMWIVYAALSWIVYAALSGIALALGFLITRNVLSTAHEETQMGLATEEANRREAAEDRRQSKLRAREKRMAARAVQ